MGPKVIQATIGQWADYAVYDPGGLEGKPRIWLGGREWTDEEIAEERKTLKFARSLFGNGIIDDYENYSSKTRP